jgi:hypothetical protein
VPMLPALRVFRLERERSESPTRAGRLVLASAATQPDLTFSRTELGAGFLDTIAAPGGPGDDELRL